jgi:hypothetical protein
LLSAVAQCDRRSDANMVSGAKRMAAATRLAGSAVRPTWLLGIVGAYVALAVGWVFVGVLLFAAMARQDSGPALPAELAAAASWLGPLLILVGVIYAVIAWGLFQIRGWACVTAMAIAAVTSLSLIAVSIAVPLVSVVLAVLILAKVLGEVVMAYYLGWKWPQPDLLLDLANGSGPPIIAAAVRARDSAPSGPPPSTAGEGPAPADAPPAAPLEPSVAVAEPPPWPPVNGSPRPPARSAMPSAGVPGRLVINAGPDAGDEFALAEDTSVGRDSSCDVVLDDPYVSRRHARVTIENHRFFIYDLGTPGGTFVNDQQIQRRLLYEGDRIRVGRTTLEFHYVSAAR